MDEWEFRSEWREESVIIVSISCETQRRMKQGIERDDGREWNRISEGFGRVEG